LRIFIHQANVVDNKQ